MYPAKSHDLIGIATVSSRFETQLHADSPEIKPSGHSLDHAFPVGLMVCPAISCIYK